MKEITTKFRETEIGKIPQDWDVVPAEEFCIKVTDGTHSTPKKQEKGRYLITSRHLSDHKLDFDNAYFISEENFLEISKRSSRYLGCFDRYDRCLFGRHLPRKM